MTELSGARPCGGPDQVRRRWVACSVPSPRWLRYDRSWTRSRCAISLPPGHTLSGPFLAYWQAHQGSVVLGAPISEPEREGLGDGTGRVDRVQWFEEWMWNCTRR